MNALASCTRSAFKHTSSFASRAFRAGYQSRNMQIKSIPMWTGTGDNYAYLIIDTKSKEAMIVDPANPSEVLPVLTTDSAQNSFTLRGVLCTHHHHDHSGGNQAMAEQIPGISILGGNKVPHRTRELADKETFNIGQGIKVTALHTPCHTQDSICYYVEDESGKKAVFTGDTLFIAGCGKFFEGSAAEMHRALNEVLASLPDETCVHPGHEYTKSNIKFGLSILPNDPHLQNLAKFCEKENQTTGRFTIGDEKKHNVFMRVNDPEVHKATGKTDPVDVLGELRKMKNNFK